MKQELLFQFLRKEEELRQICREAEEYLNQLKDQKQKLEADLNLMGRWLPFAQKREKAGIQDYWADINKAQAARENARIKLETYSPLVKETVRDWLEEEKDSEYLLSQSINQSISHFKERLAQFRSSLQKLLKSIAEAREAISVCSDHGSRNHSDRAEERIRTAIQVAQAVDRAIQEINLMNDEFASAVDGSIYASLSLPIIDQTRIVLRLQMIADEQIGPAMSDMEKLMNECHLLHDEKLAAAQETLVQVEREFETLTDGYVRQVMEALVAEMPPDHDRAAL